MSLLKSLCITVLIFTFLGCSRKFDEDSKVRIKFDQSIFASKLDVQRKANATNTDGPDWGLNDPTSLSQVTCYAVLVGANEPGLNEQSCTSAAGSTINFGIRGGFFPVSESGEVLVPAGDNRKIYIFGAASADGTCFDNFAQSAEFNFSNYSAPFVIGQTEVNLAGAEVEVPILLSNVFNDSNKVQTCDFIEPDDNDGTQPNGPYLTYYESHRTLWIDDNVLPRTVTINHNGASVDCSNDGVNYSPCDSNNSYVWEVSEYAQTHYVRVNYSDGSSEELNFQPNVVHPGVVFQSCDTNVASSSVLFTALAPLGTAGTAGDPNVVCLANGTNINDTAASQNLEDFTILAVRQGHSASITNNDTSNSAFTLNSGTANLYVKIVGVDITAGASSMPTLDLVYTGTTSPGGFYIQDAEIQSVSPGDVVFVTNTGTQSFNVDIQHSELEATSSGRALGTNNSNSFINIHDGSELISQATAIYNLDSNVTVDDSSIQSLGTSGFPVTIEQSAYMSITNSKIEEHAGLGSIDLNCSISAQTATLDVDDNIFIRKNDNTAMFTSAIVVSNNGVCTNTMNSTNNTNLFCGEDIASVTYTSIFTTAPNGAGSFDPSLNGQNSILDCP